MKKLRLMYPEKLSKELQTFLTATVVPSSWTLLGKHERQIFVHPIIVSE